LSACWSSTVLSISKPADAQRQLSPTQPAGGSRACPKRIFAVLVRECPGEERLQVWLTQATENGIQKLIGFTRGILDEQAAVAAALTLP
jgi:hypothetical protein